MRHLASAQWDRPACVFIMGHIEGDFFCHLAGRSVPTGLAIVHRIGCINAINYMFDIGKNIEIVYLMSILKSRRCYTD